MSLADSGHSASGGPPPTLAANERRRHWRETALRRREREDGAVIAAWSAALCAALAGHWPEPPGRVVGFCWPWRHEPDVRPLISFWRTRRPEIVVALPVVAGRAAPLAFRVWREGGAMVTDRFGIPTPADGQAVVPDVLLIPLNAFDERGYRLGYGAGLFDRTLATLQPRPLTVGVGFEIGRLADTLPQAHDQRLDWIATEAGIWKVADCP